MIRRALLASLLLVACREVAPPAQEVREPPRAPVRKAPVTTDRTHYVLGEGPFGPETTIVTTFTAPADRPVYILNCNGAISLGLEQLVGEKWMHAWGTEMNACLSEPIVIPAGGSRTETIVVASGADAVVDSRRTERRIENGTHRVAWYGVLTSFDFNARPFGEELPIEQRVSAPIVIERAPPSDPSETSPRQRPAEIMFIEPAHGSSVTGRAPIRVKLDRVKDSPRLYVDGEDVTEHARIADTLEYVPYQPWAPGRHEIRVVYGRSWYAWSFMVDRMEPLTAAEARRLVGLLADAINRPAADTLELRAYILHGPEALRVARKHYRTLLESVRSVRALPQQPHDPRRFPFELRGSNGRTSPVDVYQEKVIRLHSALLDYGFRSEAFMSSYLRAIDANDPVRLSQVLNPDDIDFPVERAREIIADYRRRYKNTAAIHAEFVGVEERRATMTWQLRGIGHDGKEVKEVIELGFGDGLIGVRGLQ